MESDAMEILIGMNGVFSLPIPVGVCGCPKLGGFE
jgi:hypothetical protein